MNIYYCGAKGRKDVAPDLPLSTDLPEVLEVFRTLDRSSGCLGIHLEQSAVLQVIPCKIGARIELLLTAKPSLESVEDIDTDTVERLICAAATRQDVFALAKRELRGWQYLNL